MCVDYNTAAAQPSAPRAIRVARAFRRIENLDYPQRITKWKLWRIPRYFTSCAGLISAQVKIRRSKLRNFTEPNSESCYRFGFACIE
jgi:hypothetical protein